jgi:hypothetical protein
MAFLGIIVCRTDSWNSVNYVEVFADKAASRGVSQELR